MSAVREPTVLDIYQARRRLLARLSPTPLRHSPWLSSTLGGEIALKLETVNPTNAFKIRGGFNALLALTERMRDTGTSNTGSLEVVTASAGNHGQALALASAALGLGCTVFTPKTAPATKKAAIVRYGARLRDDAPDYDATERLAREFAEASGTVWVSPYNDTDVIAGAGTIGLEIVAADPRVETVIVPIGGGGLASGVGLAIRAAAPRAQVIGVEAEASSPFTIGLARGAITPIEVRPTIADGLAGNLEAGSVTFPLVQKVVDQIVTVSEDEIRDAVKRLRAEEHLIVEAAAATAVAALLSGRISAQGRRVACVISGANTDVMM